MLESAGTNEVTLMDSAGTMMPEDAACYTEALVNAFSIPMGFHGFNDLGLSTSNAIAEVTVDHAPSEFYPFLPRPSKGPV